MHFSGTIGPYIPHSLLGPPHGPGAYCTTLYPDWVSRRLSVFCSAPFLAHCGALLLKRAAAGSRSRQCYAVSGAIQALVSTTHLFTGGTIRFAMSALGPALDSTLSGATRPCVVRSSRTNAVQISLPILFADCAVSSPETTATSSCRPKLTLPGS